MSVEKIDWSLSPEDATHYCTDNGMWYKFTGNTAYVAEGCEDSWDLSGFSGSPPDEGFIPRPVSAAISICSNEPHPPLGLTPKNIWEERMQHQRRQDIHAAMQRYIEAGKEIPNNWLEELLELNNAIGIIKAQEILAVAKQNIKEEMDVEQLDNSNEGWIELGKNEIPSGLRGKVIEREYNDGEYRKGKVDEFTWNAFQEYTDGNTVKRYRVVGETE